MTQHKRSASGGFLSHQMNNGYRENVPSPKRLAKVPPLIGIVIAYAE